MMTTGSACRPERLSTRSSFSSTSKPTRGRWAPSSLPPRAWRRGTSSSRTTACKVRYRRSYCRISRTPMAKSIHVPKAELHTPEELLASASALLASGETDVRRAVVLEAITALEAFVHQTIFPVLARTMDDLLVKWLDEKTR